MRLGIFETEHHETAMTHIRLLERAGHELVLFLTPSVAGPLRILLEQQQHRYTWVISPAGLSRKKFIRQIDTELRQRGLSHFFLHTVSGNYADWARVLDEHPITRFWVTVHDCNSLFRSHLSFHPRQVVHHFGKKKLIRKATGFIALNEHILFYLKSNNFTNKPIHYLPGALYDPPVSPISSSLDTKGICIAIPGSIDPLRRNYEEVLQLIQLAESDQIPLRIYIAGGPTTVQGQKLFNRFQQLTLQYVKLTISSDPFLPVAEFEHQLAASHFIWVTCQPGIRLPMGEPEIYGKTKSSGGVLDAIRFAKPLCIPRNLGLDSVQESAAFRYSHTGELLQFFKQRLSNPSSYAAWEKRALQMAHQFTPEVLVQRFFRFFP